MGLALVPALKHIVMYGTAAPVHQYVSTSTHLERRKEKLKNNSCVPSGIKDDVYYSRPKKNIQFILLFNIFLTVLDY